MLKNTCVPIQKCIFRGKKCKYQDVSWYALSGTLSYSILVEEEIVCTGYRRLGFSRFSTRRGGEVRARLSPLNSFVLRNLSFSIITVFM